MSDFQDLGLDPNLLQGVTAAGFTKPFPIQEQTISHLLAGADVIGQAKTGSGKTAAYGLPLLQAIDTQNRKVQAVVLAPTRELAVQITEELKKLGKFTGARIVTIYGGQSINVQIEALKRGAHAVVGTPGRVIDHLKRGTLHLSAVKTVVLDEADTMLDMGFIDDVEFIIDCTPDKRQISLFSATMPQEIINLSQKYMRNPEKVLIDSDEPSVDTLDQYYALMSQSEKLTFLLELLNREKPESAIVFCRTKYGAHRLARDLELRFLDAVPLHGDLSQSQRDHSMRLFRSGRVNILVATDVASRGIDIPQVDCVINYEVPQNSTLYFHRVGRTARAGDTGKAFTLVSEREYGDFVHIRSLTKAEIKPLRPEDEKTAPSGSHTQYSNRIERRRGRDDNRRRSRGFRQSKSGPRWQRRRQHQQQQQQQQQQHQQQRRYRR
ncbi:MAG: DEAD/DEAH box helicase [Thaumarchaeota archaeon]|nr:DEAD/DEAH box helicase [Nitrososphaerota archaeon]MCL5317187.1 DEAD/DEAH box helicase [Nitrososphaerota archaeon]